MCSYNTQLNPCRKGTDTYFNVSMAQTSIKTSVVCVFSVSLSYAINARCVTSFEFKTNQPTNKSNKNLQRKDSGSSKLSATSFGGVVRSHSYKLAVLADSTRVSQIM